MRSKVVNLLNSWMGKKVSDGSYKEIIDIYNSYPNPARGIKMQYGWAWCACTWSALAIKLGFTDIMPIEISCGNLIKIAKDMGIWKENDDYVPAFGDAILYDWDDNGVGDTTGWPDHIGTILSVNRSAGYMVVGEGNYNNAVKKRTISINGRYIRGFITPRYTMLSGDEKVEENSGSTLKKVTVSEAAHMAIAGELGNGEERKKRVTELGLDYGEVQAEINRILNNGATKTENPNQDQNQPISKKVTSTCYAKKMDNQVSGNYETKADLYLRNDAGTNKKALCVIPAGTKVSNYGYYTPFNDVKWLYVTVVIDGVQYTGFCSGAYLRRI